MDNNPDYPGSSVADFESFYSAESSDIPWQTSTNCSVCGRIEQRMNWKIAKEIAGFDPHRNKMLYYMVCSPKCEALKRKEFIV
jgi:hypothetical protein